MLNRDTFGNIFSSEEQFGEKCGVIGVWCEDTIAPYLVRKGLSTLQHRGQESAGISIYTPSSKIKTYVGMGLIPNVLTAEVLHQLGESNVAIGHNRYSTSGSTAVCNAQPITLSNGEFQLSIGHNGNVPDCQYLGEQIEEKSEGNGEISDTQLVAQLLLQERRKYSNWDDTLLHVLPQVKGAFCFIILTSDGTMYGARDPYGIRPFCLGKLSNGWIIASESVAADLIGAEFMRDIKPGEIVKVSYDGKLSSLFFGEPKRPQNCIFEYIYFSRPDSFENGIRVRNGREESGRLLGKRILKKGIKADAVVPVFDSGYPAAKGVADVLNLPIVDAITVSHYIGRTFIQPGHENRLAAVNGKHNIIPDEIVNKRIIVVDDSAVRLTTSKRLHHGLKDAGAKVVYMVFASPPVVGHCDLGIDMKSKKELPASQWEHEPFEVIEENVAKLMGADGVVYLPIEETAKAMGGVKEDFYHYPFGGPHPIRDKQYVFPKLKRKIGKKPKIALFASSNTAILDEIIKLIRTNVIHAEITSIISNTHDTTLEKLAKENSIPLFALAQPGTEQDLPIRQAYEKKLLTHLDTIAADLVVLVDWRLVFTDLFLKTLQRSQIPLINYHPSLLTAGKSQYIATSRGMIPVIRGANAIKEAYERKLLVSGVSVYQMYPGDFFESGPILLTEEVRRRKDDTLSSFTQRIEEAAIRLVPTAIKRIIHVLTEGVDVCKGDFYW